MDTTSEKVFEALRFAVEAHGYQARKKTKIPYIVHPLGVGKILIEYGFPDDLVVAGILHDTLEDTKVTGKMIADKFGAGVLTIVEGCSEQDKSLSWMERKTQMLRLAANVPEEVLTVECADKLDNIRAIRHDCAREGERFWQKLSASKEKQCWYYRSFVRVCVQRMTSGPVAAMAREFADEVKTVFGGEGPIESG
ncbi:MAG: HD domain-containing protein [Candidatus Omnitrophica bacterium]|nr:HD domain-containing protein [Candidatus Omnitrophota bacterium]